MNDRTLKEVEDIDHEMNELGSQIEAFCKHFEEGLKSCQTPPAEVDIDEVPIHVVKRRAALG